MTGFPFQVYKLDLDIEGQLKCRDNALAVYLDGDLQWRDRQYTFDGETVSIATDRPDLVALRWIPVPRSQREEFQASELGRATKWFR